MHPDASYVNFCRITAFGGFYTCAMQETDSTTLVAEYVKCGSQSAFTALVRRHINLVYSTALRKVGGDSHLARDVTQVVFTDLALKAKTLPSQFILAGWLHQDTCFRAATAVRAERRRRIREQTAVEMNSLENPANDEWQRMSPLLDDALERLSARERDAVILRFFEGHTLAQIGGALRISDDAAQKVVHRALDKLRGHLARQGLTAVPAAIAAAMATTAMQAAPAGLAGLTAEASLASAASGALMPAGFVSGAASLLLSQKGLVAIAGVVAVLGFFALQRRNAEAAPASSLRAAALRTSTAPNEIPAVSVEVLGATDPTAATPLAVATTTPAMPVKFPPIDESTLVLQIRERMAQTYAGCASYFDTGVVQTVFAGATGWSGVTEKKFSTAFVRPGRFRFPQTRRRTREEGRS